MGTKLSLVLSLFALCGLWACGEDNDLGKYCFLGYAFEDQLMADSSLTGGAWDNPDCQTGLCFKQVGYRCADGTEDCSSYDQEKIWPMCTRACSTNADCRPSGDNINGCETFVCQRSDPVAGPPVACHCACLDYIRDADDVPLSQAAFDTSDLACAP